MAYIRGEAREQTTMFPVTLDELIPADHMCGVIEAFGSRLNMAKLGFVRAEPAETGRPGYDPRDLLKLYLYGYLQQVRSSRRLEAECQRNVEVMWLLGRLQPDYKSIAEFRRMHSQAVTEGGAELVRVARSIGLVRGETVAVDGSKIRAVSSAKSLREQRRGEALPGTAGRRRRAGGSGDPAQRGVNNQGERTRLARREFHYDEKADTFRCPANQTLSRKQLQRHKTRVIYAGDPGVCGACAMKSRCTNAPQRFVHRHLHDGV